MEENMKFYTLWLSLICIIVFIIQNIFTGFTDIFMLTSQALKMPWQFLTAVFLHGGIIHLIYNLFALLLFGLILEKRIGSRNFLALFLISGILANLISFSFYPSSLGASGAIMAVMGALAVLNPTMTVWAFNLPMPMFIAAILWAGGSLMGVFGFGDQSIGYLAHLSGLVLGMLYGLFLRLRHPVQKNEGSDSPLISEDYVRIWEDNNIKGS